jgi:hypothetical protein
MRSRRQFDRRLQRLRLRQLANDVIAAVRFLRRVVSLLLLGVSLGARPRPARELATVLAAS